MEVRKNSFHFDDWVGSLGQLPQPVADHEELEWEESEVVWSATATSLPLHDSPNSPPTGGKAQYSRSNLTAVLLGHDSRVIRKKLAADPVTVARATSCGRDLLSDVVTGLSAPMNVPSWSSWMTGGREAEEKSDPTAGWSKQGEMSMPVPPHVIVANSNITRTMACSVFEGAGRTLKGRDLRRVRDGVLRKTGFLD